MYTDEWVYTLECMVDGPLIILLGFFSTMYTEEWVYTLECMVDGPLISSIVQNPDAVLPWVASLDDTAYSYYDSTNVNSKFTGASWVMFVHEKVVRPKPNLPDCLLRPCNVITEGFCHKGRLSQRGNHISFYFIVSTRVHWATKDTERACSVHRRQTLWRFISSWFLVCVLCNSCATFFARMTTGILSAALVFGKNLGCKLAIKDFVVTKKCHSLAYIELLLRVVNILAASDDTCAESGSLPSLVSYPG